MKKLIKTRWSCRRTGSVGYWLLLNIAEYQLNTPFPAIIAEAQRWR